MHTVLLDDHVDGPEVVGEQDLEGAVVPVLVLQVLDLAALQLDVLGETDIFIY